MEKKTGKLKYPRFPLRRSHAVCAALLFLLVVLETNGLAGCQKQDEPESPKKPEAEKPFLLATGKKAGDDFKFAKDFGYPVGEGGRLNPCRDGDGYYVARDYLTKELCGDHRDSSDSHLGEDWNGEGGGNTDLGDPIRSVGNGVVVYKERPSAGWGKILIILHQAPKGRPFSLPTGEKKYQVWSLYAHFKEISVDKGDAVNKGQTIGLLGKDCGSCYAHLHFEIIVDPEAPIPGGGYYLAGLCKSKDCCRTDPSDFIDLNAGKGQSD